MQCATCVCITCVIIPVSYRYYLTLSRGGYRLAEAKMARCLFLLLISNIFMTFAWYGHLKNLAGRPLWFVIVVSWSIAFFEYRFQVPGSRIGAEHFPLPQLKILQEVITLVVFCAFASYYMGVKLTWKVLWAGVCLVGTAFFIFRDGISS